MCIYFIFKEHFCLTDTLRNINCYLYWLYNESFKSYITTYFLLKMPQLDGEAFFSDFLLILVLFFLLHSETTIFENFIRIRARQIYYLNLTFLVKNFKLEVKILNLYLKNYISKFFKKVNNTYLFKI